jgi:uncharacterized protein (DUF2252 family)
MPTPRVEHLTKDERKARGEAARRRTPASSHLGWQPAPDRPDPIGILEAQDATRDPDLVPVRHARMSVSAFTFFRGSAAIMAADLAETATGGLDAQLCGDAHLANFGLFGSPERRLLFDLNDFDETLPGPIEFDLKRLCASLVVAARDNGLAEADAAEAAKAASRSYRHAMRDFAAMSALDVWYASLDADEIQASIRSLTKRLESSDQDPADLQLAKQAKARAKATERKARSRTGLQAVSKLTEVVDGSRRIVYDPPLIVPARELPQLYGLTREELPQRLRDQFRGYRRTLAPDRRRLLEQYRFVDVARKVVGVGSVGTRAFISLLQGVDEEDFLFLQVKEAQASVLEQASRKSRFRTSGERVVQGQRLMQAASDIFLGWTTSKVDGRHYYWRQLRDMKGSVEIESLRSAGMRFYGETCAWTLARAHARSGDPVALAAYAKGKGFDDAMVDFATRYADQNERDFDAFTKAIASGRLTAEG